MKRMDFLEFTSLMESLGITDRNFIILTGQRASEIGGLRWSEIDFDKDLISLPARRTKNDEAHSFPMSGPVREILNDRTQTRDLVFGRGGHGFNSWNRSCRRPFRIGAARLSRRGVSFCRCCQ
jgi:integrase